ncbi:MAG: MarR family transcriptional regulator [Actinobacteria bacterium]|nr:MarR family transcriptional regulator [Actinomycetota bacterium]
MVNESTHVGPAPLAARLRPVLLKLARELRREVHPLGVTGGQVSLLVEIERRPGIAAAELATRERISPAGMSGHVARLERASLVERRAHSRDRRRRGLVLTPAGQSVLRSVRARRTAWLAKRLQRLSAPELAAIDGAIAPLRRLLEEDA